MLTKLIIDFLSVLKNVRNAFLDLNTYLKPITTKILKLYTKIYVSSFSIQIYLGIENLSFVLHVTLDQTAVPFLEHPVA